MVCTLCTCPKQRPSALSRLPRIRNERYRIQSLASWRVSVLPIGEGGPNSAYQSSMQRHEKVLVNATEFGYLFVLCVIIIVRVLSLKCISPTVGTPYDCKCGVTMWRSAVASRSCNPSDCDIESVVSKHISTSKYQSQVSFLSLRTMSDPSLYTYPSPLEGYRDLPPLPKFVTRPRLPFPFTPAS
jgi:hypothetical protein